MSVNKTDNTPVWIISESDSTDTDFDIPGGKNIFGPIKKYHLSELGWYLLNPEPIVIHDRLVGCHIVFKKPWHKKLSDSFASIFKRKGKQLVDEHEFLAHLQLKTFSFTDKKLENHFRQINRNLKPYDSLLRYLGNADDSEVQNIAGICEDSAGNRYRLDLSGTIKEKLNYLANHLMSPVQITMKRSYLSRGLFELRGYDFKTFNPENRFQLVRFFQNGVIRFYVSGKNELPGFMIEDARLVSWLQLFEQSLRTNEKLAEAFQLCIKGKALPYKLFFTHQLEFAYTQNRLPQIFSNSIDVSKLDAEEKTIIAKTLNNQQCVISFNYIPDTNSGEERVHTHISVLHDFNALEPLKEHLPSLYNELSKKAPSSDAGKYYLLDSIKGSQDE